MTTKPKYIKGKMGVDSKCVALAEELLSDMPKARDADVTILAEMIQEVFEDCAYTIERRKDKVT